MKYLGIDYGSKKIGVALSDDGGTMAFPRTIIQNNIHAIAVIRSFVESEGVGEIVIGNSVSALGEENAIMGQVHTFVEALRTNISIPIHFVSEYGTTGAARSLRDFIKKEPRNRATRRRGGETRQLDDSAAALILQRYLETRNPRV